MAKNIKIGIITSRGGHLYQVYLLKSWWKKHDRFWVTFPGEDIDLIEKEKKYFAYYPESRNVINAFLNIFKAWSILRKERPQVLFSIGAGIAPPFFWVGKILGIKLIFIEPYDFIQHPSLTGRMVYPIADFFFVQHKRQLTWFPHAIYKGSIL